MKALDYLLSQPLLATPEAAEAARRIVEREPIVAADDGEGAVVRVAVEAVEGRRGRPVDGSEEGMTIRDGVAVIPVCGPIFRYADWFTSLCGGSTIEGLARDFTAALNDPAVKSILLNVDSPGGQANGVGEMAAMIRDGAKSKDVCAYVGHEGCSAAYWLAAACPRIVLAPGAFVGSIGVVMGYPRPDPKARSVEFVASQSPRKRPDIGTEGGKAVVQARVDDLAEVFIASVADYRGVTPEAVMSDFGQGGVLIGAKAVAAGMADAVGSYESTLSEMAAAGREPRAPMPRFQAAATAKATTPRSRPMSLRAKFLSFLSGASNDEASTLTEAEKLQALDAIGAAENSAVVAHAAAALAPGPKPDAAETAALDARSLNVAETPEFKAQAARVAELEARLAASDEAKARDDALAFARGLAAPAVARIDPAQVEAVASLHGRIAKADASGALLADFAGLLSALPTASERFAATVAGKDVAVVESVARAANPNVADPAEVAELKRLAGI